MHNFFDIYGSAGFWVLIIVSMLLFTGLGVYTVFRRRARTREAWNQLAMRTGLTLEPGSFMIPPRLTGEFRRRPASLTTYTRGSGRTTTYYTQVTLTVQNNAGGGLRLTPQGFLSGLGKALGMQDVEVGDERFDKHFVIHSQPPEFAPNILADSMLRDSLLKLSRDATVELSSSSLSYIESVLQTDVDYLESVFNTMSDLAGKIDGSGQRAKF
jgi:hypothetical protein